MGHQDQNVLCPNCHHVIDRKRCDVVSVYGKLFCNEKCFREWTYQEPKEKEEDEKRCAPFVR